MPEIPIELPEKLAEVLGDVRVPNALAEPIVALWECLNDEERKALLQLVTRIPDALTRATFLAMCAPLFLLTED